MRALTWQEPGVVRVEDRPDPVLIEPDDVILKVTTAAVCGSDLHLYHGKVPKVGPGTVVGHEFCGTVVAAGSAVRRAIPGIRCLASMFVACGQCGPCIGGRHLSCQRSALFGYGEMFGGLDGGQAEYVRVPMADVTLWPISDGIDDEDVLFAGDILATAYSGCVAARIEPGDVVAVVGAGPVGQLTVECAQLFGPSHVFAIDLMAPRLAEAADAGAIPLDATTGDVSQMLREQSGGRKADVVIEAVGSAASLKTTWHVAGTRARLALIGFLADEPWPESAGQTWLRALSITPVVGDPYAHRDRLTSLIRAGRLNPKRVISERVGLEELPDAYDRMDRRESTKVVVHP